MRSVSIRTNSFGTGSLIDFKKPISEKDYEQLVCDINEGYGNGDLITHRIGKITDQYLRDGTH